jgi:signal transduction histidine kinase/CheY-like chemotaxis protein/CHASE3 domain sensor protein
MKAFFKKFKFRSAKFNNLSLSAKMLTATIVPLLLIAALAISSYLSIRSLETSSLWVIETNKVITNGHRIEKLIVDLETGERGFLITGKDNFLEPYNNAKVELHELMLNTKKLVSDSPAQVKRLMQIEALINRWYQEAANVEINTRKQVKAGAMDSTYLQTVLAKGTGKSILDKIRGELNTLRVAFSRANNTKANLLVVAIAKDMVDQETGQRGYLITGVQSFLEPYNQGQKELKKNIESLHSIIDKAYDRKQMLLDVEQLEKLSRKWNDDIAVPAMALRAEVNAGRASQQQIQAIIQKAEGKKIIDDMRKILAHMNTAFYIANNTDGQKFIVSITKSLVDRETGIRGYLLSGKDSFLEPYRNGQTYIKKEFSNVKTLINNAYNIHQARRIVNNIQDLANEWLEQAAQPEISARDEMNKTTTTLADVIILIEKETGKNIMDQLRGQLETFINVESGLMKERENSVHSTSSVAQGGLLIGTVLIIAISLLLSLIIIRFITRQLNGTVGIAEKIADGDYDIEIELANKQDAVGIAMQKMASALKIKSLDLSEEKLKLEDQDWIKSNQSALISKLQALESLQEFAQELMSNLIPLTDAHLGLFYIADETKDHVEYNLLGSYAYKNRKNVSSKFLPGEGLVGQCALEKKTILLTEAPEDYIEISSGSGKAAPNNIIVIPIISNNKALAVIEIASAHEFTQKQEILLKFVTESLGVMIENIKSQRRTEDLLSKSNELGKTLQSQQEELKASNEELQEKTKILKESECELKTQSEELQATNEELEEKSNYLEEQKLEIENKNKSIELAKKEVESKAQALEKSGAYKSEFLANMSHELRTPLNSLLILSKSLADNDEGNLTAEQIEECNIIHTGGQELLTLINDILDLSKVEAGKMELVLEETLLSHLLNDLEGQFNPVAETRNLTFKAEVAQGVPQTILMDEHKVAQVLKNFLSNAFKFTKEGSVSLRIDKPADTHQFVNQNLSAISAISISVIDTGVGIPAEKQADIFEAFQQVDGSTSREYGGTGLGLTISRQLANLMSGEIQIQSSEGQGTTFSLYLPINPDQNISISADPNMPINTNSNVPNQLNDAVITDMTNIDTDLEWIDDDRSSIDKSSNVLLIIDDDAIFSKYIMKAGRKQGYLCLAAGNGTSGIALALKYQPEAIILDLGLPDISGEQVLNDLKHHLKTRHIPVHIVSAADVNQSLFENGAIGFLQKPVEEDELGEMLNHINTIISREIKVVLLIEDNIGSQTSIKKLVSNSNIEIITVDNGKLALEKILAGNIDVIILDLSLPDMSGSELLESLAHESIDLPPIIVYTGKELSEAEYSELRNYTSSIVIKGADSPERLLDEVSLFLHSVNAQLPTEQQQMLAKTHSIDGNLDGHLILLVDDDMRNLFALSKALTKQGLQVEIAKDGQSALDTLASNSNIELVIMDIMMPIMDGYTAISKIRQQKQYEELPILALTAKAMPEDRQKCIDAGANDYLAKPVDVDRLLSLMRVWLEKK